MLPEKRPTLFGMTDETGFIDAGFTQQKVIIALVRIVAIAAGHAAESQGMVTGAKRVGLPVGMTSETSLLLKKRIKYRIHFAMDLVAGRTGNVFRFMHAAEPAKAPVGFMTFETDFVLDRHGCMRICTKHHRRLNVSTTTLGASMVFSRTMA